MEYLVIIAFIGLIIFKAIKKGKKAAESEMQKTMLPGKRAVSPSPKTEKQPTLADNWEKWFSDDKWETLPTPKKKNSTTPRKIETVEKKNLEKEHIAKDALPHSIQEIKLPSREEVRRAIIYSEILNRKY